MSGEVEVLMDVAILGEQVDNFWRTDVGRFLSEHIEEERAAGLEALTTVDAENPKLVREAQNTVWRAAQMKGWISQAIMSGLKAKMVLEDRMEDNG